MHKKVSQSVPRHLSHSARVSLLAVSCFVLASGTAMPSLKRIVFAEDYQAQITALTAENDANRAVLGDLEAQATSYADAITKMQQQIDALQASLNANMDLQASLQKQIAEAQAEIDRQRGILAEDIKAMYVDGTPSSLEMLASSDNFSDYVDKQEYRSRVQSKLQDTLKRIAELEAQLQTEKAKVEVLIRDMQIQQSQLSAERTKQWELLNLNESKQAEYDAMIKANNSKVAELRAAQAAANRRLSGGTASGVTAGDPGHGGYPAYLANASQDSLVDPWGMYNRECVSYTAWKVFQTYGYMPYWGGVGNANQWPGNAARAGIPTGSTPKVGSVAVWNVGYYGHVMWVEAVNADGSIWISQYNYDFNGHYSEMLVSAGMASNLTYIYFN
jgi:surface antigen